MGIQEAQKENEKENMDNKLDELKKKFFRTQVPVYAVSAVTGEGLNEVLEKAFEAVAKCLLSISNTMVNS